MSLALSVACDATGHSFSLVFTVPHSWPLFPLSSSHVSILRTVFPRLHKQIPSRPVTRTATTLRVFLSVSSSLWWVFLGGYSLKIRAGKLSSVQGGEEEEGTLSNPAFNNKGNSQLACSYTYSFSEPKFGRRRDWWLQSPPNIRGEDLIRLI